MHYIGANSYFFIIGIEVINLKAKGSEINAIPLFPRKISNNFSVDNIKKIELNEYVYDFSIDYDFIEVDDILVFIEKTWFKIMFTFIKKMFFAAMTFVGCGALNAITLKCVSMSNQKCLVRPAIMNINTNEPLFYPYIIAVNKYIGSCNN